MDGVLNPLIVVINIIIGFVIGMVIGKVFTPSKIYHGPCSTDIKKKIFKSSDGMCYRLIPEVHICPIKESMNKNSSSNKYNT